MCIRNQASEICVENLRHNGFMKRLLLTPLFLLLLAGCESKKDICADLFAGEITIGDANDRLGLGLENSDHVVYYCGFYRN
mgnify:FL=1